MAIKVYVASITGKTDVSHLYICMSQRHVLKHLYFWGYTLIYYLQIKKQIQRIILILEGYQIKHDAVDITLTENHEERAYMQTHSEPAEAGKNPLPPQIFNDGEYCGVSVH
jgi:hypothetical protein